MSAGRFSERSYQQRQLVRRAMGLGVCSGSGGWLIDKQREYLLEVFADYVLDYDEAGEAVAREIVQDVVDRIKTAPGWRKKDKESRQ